MILFYTDAKKNNLLLVESEIVNDGYDAIDNGDQQVGEEEQVVKLAFVHVGQLYPNSGEGPKVIEAVLNGSQVDQLAKIKVHEGPLPL